MCVFPHPPHAPTENASSNYEVDFQILYVPSNDEQRQQIPLSDMNHEILNGSFWDPFLQW